MNQPRECRVQNTELNCHWKFLLLLLQTRFLLWFESAHVPKASFLLLCLSQIFGRVITAEPNHHYLFQRIESRAKHFFSQDKPITQVDSSPSYPTLASCLAVILLHTKTLKKEVDLSPGWLCSSRSTTEGGWSWWHFENSFLGEQERAGWKTVILQQKWKKLGFQQANAEGNGILWVMNFKHFYKLCRFQLDMSSSDWIGMREALENCSFCFPRSPSLISSSSLGSFLTVL